MYKDKECFEDVYPPFVYEVTVSKINMSSDGNGNDDDKNGNDDEMNNKNDINKDDKNDIEKKNIQNKNKEKSENKNEFKESTKNEKKTKKEEEKNESNKIIKIYNPPSLFIISLISVAKYMQIDINTNTNENQILNNDSYDKNDHSYNPYKKSPKKDVFQISSSIISKIVPEYIKQRLCKYYIKNKKITGSEKFRDFIIISDYGFNYPENIICNNIKIEVEDVNILTFLQNSNVLLKKLVLNFNKLNNSCVSILVNSISSVVWPTLIVLNLSMNILDITSVQHITDGKWMYDCLIR